MKKNIILISGFYPTNGILSLINYLAYSLISNKKFKKKFNLKILIFNENFFIKIKKIIFNTYLILKNKFLKEKNRIHNYAYDPKKFIYDNLDLKNNIVLYSKENNLSYLKPSLIFPIYFPIKKNYINSIGYIYDFQHIDLPKLFSKKEINLRNRLFLKIIKTNNIIFVNSNYVKKKIISEYKISKNRIIKIPFLPYVNYKIRKENFIKLKKKYKIEKSFFIICNHFWKHKNHDIAFKAFHKFLHSNPNYQLICTGDLTDTRHPNYFKNLQKKYKKIIDENKLLILGMIPKKDQITLLKNSTCVIQPTSYEGGPGGFSTYEAIAYKKKILLSDIEVNKEIKEQNVFFFKNNSSQDLLRKLISLKKNKNRFNERMIYKISNKNKMKLGSFLYNQIKKIV